MATYAQVINSVREFTFDRFVTPSFFITHTNKIGTWKVVINDTHFKVLDGTVEKVSLAFSDHATLNDIIQAVIAAGQPIEIIYSGSFVPSDPSNSLLPTSVTLEQYKPLFRKYYFSDAYLEENFIRYMLEIMKVPEKALEGVVWNDEFQDATFDHYRMTHFTLWVSYQVVAKRRLYELAAQALMQSTLGGNPDLMGGVDYVNNSDFTLSGPGEDVTVQVGDVFTMNEDKNTALGIHNSGEIPQGMKPPWAIGSDNTLMDYYSFWYRLQLWLRNEFEQRTGDYSLRQNEMIQGKIHLDATNSNKYWSYFDSYPWVYSPYPRGLGGMDTTPNLRT